MIEVESLSKRFGSVEALADVGFDARDGRITALLGANGAGKSTTLRILSTVIRPDAGRATISGVDVLADPRAARRRAGVLPHGAGLYPHLTGRENIEYYGRLHGLDRGRLERRCDELVERLALDSVAHRRAQGFSQGERTKVALARALVHEPGNLILDEPTSGLDVLAARELRAWLRELADGGSSVLLSSHVMRDIETLADELVIIANGRIAETGSPAELRQKFGDENLEEIFVSSMQREQ